MLKSNFRGGEEKSLDTIPLAKGNVVYAVTVAGVANDGTIYVSKMSTDLVATTGLWTKFDKRVSSGGVMVDWQGQFCIRKSIEYSPGILFVIAFDACIVVFKFAEWMLDHSSLRSKATYNGLVSFAHLFLLKGNRQS